MEEKRRREGRGEKHKEKGRLKTPTNFCPPKVFLREPQGQAWWGAKCLCFPQKARSFCLLLSFWDLGHLKKKKKRTTNWKFVEYLLVPDCMEPRSSVQTKLNNQSP